jgi:hypothetical protein
MSQPERHQSELEAEHRGKAEPRVYRYVIVHHGGFAPCFDGGLCTLACCKPAIRRTAKLGDWVLGFAPRSRGEARLLYSMRVGRIVDFATYSTDPAYAGRRDNIWRTNGRGGFRHVGPKGLHDDAEAKKRDLGGANVLVADRYWDFGPEGLDLNAAVGADRAHRLWFSGRGHKVNGPLPGDLDSFLAAINERRSQEQARGRAGTHRRQWATRHC